MAEKTRSNPKTTAAVSQIVGNAGARYAAGQARIGAERLAAHEKAISQINRLRKGAVAAHNNAVAWQNQKLANIRKGYNPGLTGADRALQRARAELRQYNENVETVARRAAKGRTNTLLRDNARAISQTREAHSRVISRINSLERFNAITGGVPERYVAPHREAARGLRDAMAFNVAERRQLSWSSPAREAAEIKANMTRMMRSAHARDLRQAVFNAESTRDLIASRMNDSMRKTVLHARNAAADIQSRFGSAAAKAMEKAGPKASFLQRTLARVAKLGQMGSGVVSEGASKLVSGATRASRGTLLTLGDTFVSPAELAARATAGGKLEKSIVSAAKTTVGLAKGTAGLAKKAGGLALKVATSPVMMPAKGISKVFTGVERVGSLVAGSGIGGKAIRAVTNAGGLAGGFATGSWIDAGLNYAQFKAEGHSLSDLGKTIGSVTVDGHRVELKNPSLGDVVLSRKYWGEALRGGVRQLSMGVLGNNEWGWEANGGPDPEEFNRRLQMGLDPSTGKALVSTDGTDVSGIIARQNVAVNGAVARNKAVTSYFMSFDPSRKGKVDAAAAANGARLLGLANPSSMDAAGFMSAARSIGADRDAKIEALKQNPEAVGGKAIDDMMKRGRLTREEATAKYVDIVTRNITKQHDDRLALMMKSDLATKASDLNRKNAYLALTGRDYDVDTSAKLDDDAKQRYAEFNETWAGMSGYDRATFDADAFRKSLSSDADEAYKAMTAEPKED